MANDIMDLLRKQALDSLQEAIGGQQQKSSNGSGGPGKGLLAGAALAAAAPMARRGFQAYRSGQLDDFMSKLGTGEALQDVRSRFESNDDDGDEDERRDEDEQDGGARARGEDDSDGEGGDQEDGDDDEREPGDGSLAIGKNRRMPIQQSVDVAVSLETAYNQFTQFEDWPQFMHRVTNVSQDDEGTVKFTSKIWTRTREFEAKIITQRPDDRIMWKVSQGITHAGIVSFHELAPRLTRIELTLDVKPGGMLEKAARGMRHIKRAVRADLHRFKAFIEMQELETGAWRGVIEDGEVVEPHDESYDEEREYSDIEDLKDEAEGDSGDEDSSEESEASDE
ncbi:MAG TPA: SRPBCC family protein, partial [Pseudonocardia sp.]|nr:SRPBCC family protein [Pseudonocardia sp.]